ncbi:hypothetical protein JXB41_04585 [Candidatus Woesearchaeota archaeon]|nr:hypothetical protein [Candidatus Woesearchaeota archaeon]
MFKKKAEHFIEIEKKKKKRKRADDNKLEFNNTFDTYSVVELDFFYKSKYNIYRQGTREIGRCKENPLEVLEILFPEYNITDVCGYNLFGLKNIYSIPPIGLSINKIKKDCGVKETIEEILKSDKMSIAKREESIPNELLQSIINNFKETHLCILLPEEGKMAYERYWIYDVLGKFLK